MKIALEMSSPRVEDVFGQKVLPNAHNIKIRKFVVSIGKVLKQKT